MRSKELQRRGVTLTEMFVVGFCGLVVLATALPVLARVGSASGETRSMSNLRILAAAHEGYAQTFDQRQLTFIPDYCGYYYGNCQTIVTTVECPPQLILGTGINGSIWGYYLGGGLCSAYPGTCANGWDAYKPIEFSGPNAQFGSFRLGNAAAFNDFVEGRFYSDTFYAPNDTIPYSISAYYRDNVIDFHYTASLGYALSSYCLSPAAMWHPDVFGDAYGGFRHPNSFAEGYASPSVTQCAYPDLKTRLLEHDWNDNPPSPSASGNDEAAIMYPFNASTVVAPFAAFFDGHVTRVPNTKAISDDNAYFAASGLRLWSRTTPIGEAGYAPDQAFDPPGTARTSHTVLTANGILGRDVLAPK